jgi:cation diffusion facilitator CzcD-associated flavoprotein CzcO
MELPAVVLATGYFSRPAEPLPAYPHDQSVPIAHAAHFPGAARAKALAGGKPVIVVGRRISAGQLMVELHDHGVDVVLSTRAPVQFRRDGVGGALKDFLYYFYEELLIRLKPSLQLPSFPIMDGGRSRQLVEAGAIAVVGQIRSVDQGEVEFDDGHRRHAGLIIHATGYGPALPAFTGLTLQQDPDGLPSCEGWESKDVPGLYFLGLDNRVNYRSRTLRGIRRDAAALARILRQRLDRAQS